MTSLLGRLLAPGRAARCFVVAVSVLLLAGCTSVAPESGTASTHAATADAVPRREAADDTLATPSSDVPDADGGAWRFRALSYLWVPGIDGRAGSNGDIADVDLGVSDTADVLTDHLQKGVLVHAEAQKGRFGAFGEVVALELEDDSSNTVVVGPVRLPNGTVVSPRRKIELETEATLQMTIAELGATIALTPADDAAAESDVVVEGLLGVRYYDVELDLRVNRERLTKDGTDWVDGFVGARARFALDEEREWTLAVRGDVGGFGVGTSSDVAWRATALLSWRPWESTSIFAGWHVLDIDAERGSGSSRAVFDVRLSGPVLGVVYEF